MHQLLGTFTTRWVALMSGAAHATAAMHQLERASPAPPPAGDATAAAPPGRIRTREQAPRPAAIRVAAAPAWPPGFVSGYHRPHHEAD